MPRAMPCWPACYARAREKSIPCTSGTLAHQLRATPDTVKGSAAVMTRLVQLVDGVPGVVRHDTQQRLLLRQHLAPLDRDLDGLALPGRRHARLLQHGCAHGPRLTESARAARRTPAVHSFLRWRQLAVQTHSTADNQPLALAALRIPIASRCALAAVPQTAHLHMQRLARPFRNAPRYPCCLRPRAAARHHIINLTRTSRASSVRAATSALTGQAIRC